MKVDKLTLGRIFDHTERFEAPLFQRPYVWVEDRNWVPLWDSVKDLLDHRLAERAVRPHFLGAIVLDQLRTITGKILARQVIDGQQRLTTLQLAFASARDLAEEAQFHKHAMALRKLTDNDVPLSDDPDEIFKMWPTNADRDVFRDVMKAGSASKVEALLKKTDSGDKLIPSAYLYFYAAFKEWAESADPPLFAQRLEALYTTLRDDVHVVVIDLETEDDAQEIFETLNALGTPLLPADLVKNYLFRLADLNHQPTLKLYEQFWAPFDEDRSYWRKEVRQGRLNRPRIDLFLHHYLTLMRAEEVNAMKLFTTFRDHVESNGSDAAKQMATFRHYADVYRSMEELELSSREELFIYRLEQLDTTTLFPLLLEIFKRYRNPERRDEFEQILISLESFVVRRTVCGLTTKNYNKLIVSLIKQLRQADDFSPVAIREFLLEQSSDTNRWPTDEEFRVAWMTTKLYRAIRRSKLRMILEALEIASRTGKTEKVWVERKLTIEHLMPVAWERHWPLVIEQSTAEGIEKAGEHRSEVIHRIGNLSLLTRGLNPAVSNGPWLRKRDEILKHSALSINRSFGTIQVWNEDSIEMRSAALFDVAKKIWPR
jgi:uncharacterized protein with ParB-like and HNH nuclease domain